MNLNKNKYIKTESDIIEDIYNKTKDEYINLTKEERSKLKRKLKNKVNESGFLGILLSFIGLFNDVIVDLLQFALAEDVNKIINSMNKGIMKLTLEFFTTKIVTRSFIVVFIGILLLIVYYSYKNAKTKLDVIEEVDNDENMYLDNKNKLRYMLLLGLYEKYYTVAIEISSDVFENLAPPLNKNIKAELERMKNENLIKENNKEIIITKDGIELIEQIFSIDKYLRNYEKSKIAENILSNTKYTITENDNKMIKS